MISCRFRPFVTWDTVRFGYSSYDNVITLFFIVTLTEQSMPMQFSCLPLKDICGIVSLTIPVQKGDSAGANWFDMPKTDLTTEMKRDWQILRMRNILDPKHQRKNLQSEPPKYSQVGEIIAGPTDYYSARLTRKERKRNLLEEAMSTRDDVKMKTKYAGIQKRKTSGKRAFYQNLVQRRRKGKT